MRATAFERDLWLVVLACSGGIRVSLAVLIRLIDAELLAAEIRVKA